MSKKAVVLIEATVGRVREVTAALKELDKVTSADAVTGPYDVIAIVEAEDFIAIGHVVTAKIQAISGVSRTVVCATHKINEEGIMPQAYCVKCRQKREIKDPQQITMKNNRPAVKGTCPVCGTKLVRLGKA